jgi:hypothetical protein
MRRTHYLALGLSIVASLGACAASSEDGEAGDSALSSPDDGYASDPNSVAAPAPPNALPKSYVTLSAADKLDALRTLVSTDEYCRAQPYDAAGCVLPQGKSFSFKALPSLFSLGTTFDTASDEMPEGRRKLLRPAGIVATFTFEASYPDQPADPASVGRRGPYTGLLAPGRGPIAGVLRFSDNGVKSFNPAVALKFLIDGKPSVNTLAAVSMDGQDNDHNFFSRPITSHLEPAHGIAAKFIWDLFGLVLKKDPSLLELDNLAAVTADGNEVSADELRAPYELYYVAHGDLGRRFTSTPHEYRQDLHSLEPGTVVYDLLARAAPTDPPSSREKIGEIRLTSTPIATKAGDERLFFQHNRGSSR